MSEAGISRYARSICLVVVVTCALVAASTSGASPVAASGYQAHLNGLCRSYTPHLETLESALNKAMGHNAYNFGVDLGLYLELGVAQDKAIMGYQPIPSGLSSQMTRIFSLLRQIDSHAEQTLVDAKGGKAAWVTELKTTGRLASPLNKLFDGAGLRDCGSNQT